jgi:beta-galactosidase
MGNRRRIYGSIKRRCFPRALIVGLIAGGLATFAPSAALAQISGGNLALRAHATASSSAAGTSPDFLADGDIAHKQWAPKDGASPSESWAQLDWPTEVQLQEVVVRQSGDPKLTHVDIEVSDASNHWTLLQSIGDSEHLLTRLILAQFPPQKTKALRISNFSGSFSINELEVYDRRDPPEIVLGSDLRNHIFGIVTDGFGTRPFAHAAVHLQGTAGHKPWQLSTETDPSGLFQVEMPVGLEGAITATAQIVGGDSAKKTLQAGDLSPGLSLIDLDAPQIQLDGAWKFKPDPEPDFFQPQYADRDWKEIKVPAHWTMEGFDSQTGVSAYRRHVQIPASFRGKRVKLLFEGVYSGAEVWLNGQRIGSHEGGFSPFELDCTDAARIESDNILAVRVREDTVSSHLDDMSHYADFPLAGITRSVRLFALPDEHIRRFHVATAFDPNYKDATLSLDFSLENESGQPSHTASLTISLKDPEGHSVSLDGNRLELNLSPWSRVEKHIEFHVGAPQHWEAEHPRLYTLSAELSNGAESGTVSRRVGFRQVEIRGTKFLINGAPVKLRGVGYYEAAPLSGRVVSTELLRQDLLMLKDVNLDAFRNEVMLPLEDLFNDSDEMGFYVEAEAPFCWVDESSDLRYLPIFVQRAAEVLDRDRSHPSIIIWSIGNESSWGPDFEAAHQFVKTQDNTRPTSAGMSESLELNTLHNPISLDRMKEHENETVPIIWDESFCIFQGRLWGDTRETWLDPGDRDYYISPHIDIWNAVQESKNVQGSMIWAWVDDIFLVPGRDSEYGRGGIGRPEHPIDGIYRMPGRGIVGDAPWGLIDGWRRKKPEYWHIKMLMSPIHLQVRNLSQWKPGEPVTFGVDNRYEFTNLSETTLEWSVGNERGTLHPDIAPRSSGRITIPAQSIKAGDIVQLSFLDAQGHLIIPHRMRVGTVAVLKNRNFNKVGALRYIREDYWLGGPLERFIGDDFEIAFDGGNGRIRRALVNRQPVLYQSPKLHVLPIEGTLNEFPVYETWRLTKPLEVHAEGENYEIVETGTYRDFAGELRYLISPDGGIGVSYDFTYTGTDVRAREVGMQFGVPPWCDRLQWHRVGEWTVYPEDHIGRNDGAAMAHASGPQSVPPSQPFAQDDGAIGTNDFRSTKRNFVFASLVDKDGYGIGIEAEGSQHLRTTVAGDIIEVNVNDWFGGVAATAWGEWWRNYGQGQDLRPDDPNEGVSHNRVSGSMQLHLLSPQSSTEWLKKMQSIADAAD